MTDVLEHECLKMSSFFPSRNIVINLKSSLLELRACSIQILQFSGVVLAAK